MCKNWREKGNCKYGDKCLFAHGTDELTKRSSANGPEPAKPPAPAPAAEPAKEVVAPTATTSPTSPKVTGETKISQAESSPQETKVSLPVLQSSSATSANKQDLFDTPAKESTGAESQTKQPTDQSEINTPAFSNVQQSTTESTGNTQAAIDTTFSKLSAQQI